MTEVLFKPSVLGEFAFLFVSVFLSMTEVLFKPSVLGEFAFLAQPAPLPYRLRSDGAGSLWPWKVASTLRCRTDNYCILFASKFIILFLRIAP